jgi:Exo-beta-D-glucosaminidase Ig-fold domain
MADGIEVLTCFWTGNYFTLAPSESISVSVTCPFAAINGKKTEIRVSGWNVEEKVIK